MEFKELTISNLNSVSDCCYDLKTLSSRGVNYLGKKNLWIESNLARGMSGLISYDSGRVTSFSLEFPIEIAPFPIIGKNISIVGCNWIDPSMTTPNYKNIVLEKIIDRIERKKYRGIVIFAPLGIDSKLLESFGFVEIANIVHFGVQTDVMWLDFDSGSMPIIKRPSPLPPNKPGLKTLDLFYPVFCPLGTALVSKVFEIFNPISTQIDLRQYQITDRKSILEYGRILAFYIDGIDYLRPILVGSTLEQLIGESATLAP
jgi:hypothetical protein